MKKFFSQKTLPFWLLGCEVKPLPSEANLIVGYFRLKYQYFRVVFATPVSSFMTIQNMRLSEKKMLWWTFPLKLKDHLCPGRKPAAPSHPNNVCIIPSKEICEILLLGRDQDQVPVQVNVMVRVRVQVMDQNLTDISSRTTSTSTLSELRQLFPETSQRGNRRNWTRNLILYR